jgi:hypothetical protein
MICSNIAADRHANIAVHVGPSPLGAWLKSTLARLMSASAKAPPPRDRVREAAELRTWAACVQRTDPRFAADLFAAADRHEIMGL